MPVLLRRFKFFTALSLFAVYLLILVGGIVRSTGAGMGCPDWPKCFGKWVPPTELSQLPPDYKTRFKVQGKEIADFNAVKTWTEYLNRMLGAVVGLLVFLTFLFSFAALKKAPSLVWFSFLLLLMVGFQGWLGAQVVSSNLATYMVTAHMLVALLIVGVLLYIVRKTQQNRPKTFYRGGRRLLKNILLLCLLLSVVQILAGTQVREQVDILAKTIGELGRNQWMDQIGTTFYLHRSFSIILLGANLYFVYLVRKHTTDSDSRFFRYLNPSSWQNGDTKAAATSALRPKIYLDWSLILLLLLGLEIASGMIMNYFSIPAAMQPIHLLCATLVFGLQFYIFLCKF